MSKKISSLILALLLVGTVAFLAARHYTTKQDATAGSLDTKIKITTSFYPLAFLAERVGGEHVSVTDITPTGAEPHDYEPTARDVANIESSELLILNGRGFEPWAEKIKTALEGKQVTVLEAGSKLMTRSVVEKEEGHPGEDHADTAVSDPHVWLDPILAEEMAREIAASLKNIDPENAGAYDTNVETIVDDLNNLHARFDRKLKTCATRDIVTTHSAFGYLAERYRLNQIAISGLSPDAEPSPRDLAEVTEFAKKNNVKYIFFEELVSPRLADTLAREVGAKTLVLNPIEGLTPEQNTAGENYISLMDKNLVNLQTALSCE